MKIIVNFTPSSDHLQLFLYILVYKLTVDIDLVVGHNISHNFILIRTVKMLPVQEKITKDETQCEDVALHCTSSLCGLLKLID